jgi:hypothetical protein
MKITVECDNIGQQYTVPGIQYITIYCKKPVHFVNVNIIIVVFGNII